MCKCLKILLKKRMVNVIGGVLLIFVCVILPVCAENDGVQILTGQSVIYSAEDAIDVSVVFLNRELYNEHISLAYHVKDSEGNILQYETSRYPVTINEDGVAKVTVNVNVSDIKTEKGIMFLEFDLVDEQNFFWFSDRENINFQSSIVRCETKGFDRLVNFLKQEIGKRPVAFGCNIAVFIGFWGAVFALKRDSSIAQKR